MHSVHNRASKASWHNSANIVVIFLIIFLGYTFILFKVLNGPAINNMDELEAQKIQSSLLQRLINEQEQELKQVRKKNSLQLTDLPKSISSSGNQPVNLEESSSQHLISIRPGVIILGMHRSGTSVLGGLVNKMGLKTGGPLIQAAEDNAKGFFERIDVVLQNDYLMQKQNIHYSHNTYKYDSLLALKHILNDDGKLFKEGKRGLAFLNNKDNYPWMLKDPRLCITFRTWLPLLNFYPAILFTYRHPMDVALSMNKREFEQFAVNKGLRLWYTYNRRAIEQSSDLCRVVTSHRKIMQESQKELDKIYHALHECGVDVPKKLGESEINDFIDLKLQHGKSTLKESTCDEDLTVIKPPSTWPTTDDAHIRLYREVMRLYCAMEDGTAFRKGFQFAPFVKDD
jgi:hypothetical protein